MRDPTRNENYFNYVILCCVLYAHTQHNLTFVLAIGVTAKTLTYVSTTVVAYDCTNCIFTCSAHWFVTIPQIIWNQSIMNFNLRQIDWRKRLKRIKKNAVKTFHVNFEHIFLNVNIDISILLHIYNQIIFDFHFIISGGMMITYLIVKLSINQLIRLSSRLALNHETFEIATRHSVPPNGNYLQRSLYARA